MTRKTSILIHYTHKETLGHTTRILALCHALAKNYASTADVHVLQGGIPQPFIRFPKSTHLIHTPAPFDSRASFNGIRHQENLAQRARFVLETARRIQPDVLITEFFPLGRIEYLPELLPTLRYIHSQGARIYSSIGYPHLLDLPKLQEKRFTDILPSIVALYDNILIHTPDGLENPYFRASIRSKEYRACYDEFFEKISHKILYTGYIVPHAEKLSPRTRALVKGHNKEFIVVVSRGGGAVFPKIIVHAIQAQGLLGDRYRFIIAAGPSTTDAERALFQSYLKKTMSKNIFLFDHLADLPYCFKNCDASLSMCGYNTSVQLLVFGTPNVIIPYANKLSKEPANDQLARSQLLHERLKSTVIHYTNMTPEKIAKAIEEKCRAPRPNPAPQEWFSGSTLSADILCQ